MYHRKHLKNDTEFILDSPRENGNSMELRSKKFRKDYDDVKEMFKVAKYDPSV